MHEALADLHTLRIGTQGGLVHPHTRKGWGYLLLRLGRDTMEAYERHNAQPELHGDAFDGLIADATLDGLTVQQQGTGATAP